MKTLLRIVIGLILIIAVLAFKTYYQSGAFTKVGDQFSGTTQRLEGLPGVEDITINQKSGIAFLSSMDRWKWKQDPETGGAIYTLNLNDSILTPVIKTTDFKEEFKPHGISLYQSPEGKEFLFVINHRHNANYVEVFEHRNDSLLHKESITDPLMISPNDIVGVGERSFYFTNDHNEKASTMRMVKDLLAIGTGEVIYYVDGNATRTSIEGIQYANGINVSNDGNTLYLASTTGKEILIYSRDKQTGALTETGRISCNTGVDNIEVDPDDNLWIGCHPQMLKFLAHSKDEREISPSHIIRLSPATPGPFAQETIYMNTGAEISASSVGAPYQNKLLIGPVFQRHILVATMK